MEAETQDYFMLMFMFLPPIPWKESKILTLAKGGVVATKILTLTHKGLVIDQQDDSLEKNNNMVVVICLVQYTS